MVTGIITKAGAKKCSVQHTAAAKKKYVKYKLHSRLCVICHSDITV